MPSNKVKSLKMSLLNLFFQWQLLQRWRLAVFFKAIMVRCISKAVSYSRKGLYCGEMGSQPKLKVDLPVTVQNCV